VLPLTDIHCHLLAGLDDGPRTLDDAVAMCSLAASQGTRIISALAHQNEYYPHVTADLIRQSTSILVDRLKGSDIPIAVFPSAEVMVKPDIEKSWERGELMSVADKGQYLLVEMPHRLFVDLRDIVRGLGQYNLRVILAHPERHAEFLHEPGRIEELIDLGCLVQVSSSSITNPASSRDAHALKNWLKRGVVHLLGSDGHSLNRRPPKVAEAFRQISQIAGAAAAERICRSNGETIVAGTPLRTTKPTPPTRRWFWFT